MIEQPIGGTPIDTQQSLLLSLSDDSTAAVKKDAGIQTEKEKLTAAQKKFVDLISIIPPTTTLILIEILPAHLTKN